MIFIQCPFLKSIKCIDISANCTARELINIISCKTGIPSESLSVFTNTCQLLPEHKVDDGATVHLTLQLPGGKGGFGSMLRAIGAQIEKTTNREACRDLSGRRLRDINEEQRLKKWLDKKVEREKEKERRRKERLERMKQLPKHDFYDPEYNKQRSELPDRIHDALSEGFKKSDKLVTIKAGASSSSSKGPPAKKRCPWPELDVSSNSEDSDNEVNREPEIGDSDSSISSSSSTVQVSSSSQDPDVQEESSSIGVESKEEKVDKVEDELNPVPGSSKVEESLDVNVLKEEIMAYSNAADIEKLGLERLKSMLQAFGMKCGGTLQQRAERIWLIRGLDIKDIPKNLQAKGK